MYLMKAFPVCTRRWQQDSIPIQYDTHHPLRWPPLDVSTRRWACRGGYVQEGWACPGGVGVFEGQECICPGVGAYIQEGGGGYPSTPKRNMEPGIPTSPRRDQEYLPQKGHATRDTHPAVDRQTDTCKNITLPQLRWRAVK